MNASRPSEHPPVRGQNVQMLLMNTFSVLSLQLKKLRCFALFLFVSFIDIDMHAPQQPRAVSYCNYCLSSFVLFPKTCRFLCTRY